MPPILGRELKKAIRVLGKLPDRKDLTSDEQLLAVIASIQTLYQDIDDVLNEKLSDAEKFQKIKLLNDSIGQICTKVLPG